MKGRALETEWRREVISDIIGIGYQAVIVNLDSNFKSMVALSLSPRSVLLNDACLQATERKQSQSLHALRMYVNYSIIIIIMK